jgi:4-hydroxy-tetrahydrodipicolinate reductase
MINIVLCGAAGRMGLEIIKAAQASDDVDVIAGVEVKGNKSVGKTISGVKISDNILSVVQNADCVVDFTHHTATIGILKMVNRHKKPYVTGTTGFSDSELQEIENVSKNFPLFIAPNMSVGVNHLYNLVESSAAALADADIEIIETHHRQKKDAPSGTAKAIAMILKEVKPGVGFVYGREGATGERKRGEICIHSLRGGDVVGEHRVLFLGDGEFLELRHHATSRRCFAAGALAAVRFIVNKAPGLYNMQDLLKSG